MQTKYITETNSDLVTTTYSDTFELESAETLSVQAVIDVNTPAAKTFLAGESEVTTLTFDTQANTDSGDYVVIYDTAGLGWAVYADLSGTDPEPSGAIYAAIPAGRKGAADLSAATTAATVAAAFELAFDALTSVPFATDDSANDGTMLVTMTLRGTTTDAVVKNEDDSGAGSIQEAQTNQGVASTVSVSANTITSVAHGFVTGLKGQVSSTATTPGNLTAVTDFFVIKVDADTYKLAESLVLALAGTAVDITDQGTDGATHTFTPTALAGGSIKLQKSNDGSNWSDEGSATNITADATVWLEKDKPGFRFARVYSTLTAGKMSMVLYSAVKKV
jgi:hypothetical protein